MTINVEMEESPEGKHVTRERRGPQCVQRWKWLNDTESAMFPTDHSVVSACFVVEDRWSQCVWSHVVPSKRIDNLQGVSCLSGHLDEMGYGRTVLKSDQERSFRAFVYYSRQKDCIT